MDTNLITVGQPIPRNSNAFPLPGRKVLVTWNTGETVTCDIAQALAARKIFAALRDDDRLFETLRANEDGTAIIWDNDAELSAIWLERLAIH